jgi:hypothetical protein
MIKRAAADRVVIWDSGFLPTTARGADSSCQIVLVERLAYERLDHRLAADIQLLGGPVQFFQHARRQVNIRSLDRTHHLAGIGEEPGHVSALIGKAGDSFCCYWLARLTSVLHGVCAPAWYLPEIFENIPGKVFLDQVSVQRTDANLGHWATYPCKLHELPYSLIRTICFRWESY